MELGGVVQMRCGTQAKGSCLRPMPVPQHGEGRCVVSRGIPTKVGWGVVGEGGKQCVG